MADIGAGPRLTIMVIRIISNSLTYPHPPTRYCSPFVDLFSLWALQVPILSCLFLSIFLFLLPFLSIRPFPTPCRLSASVNHVGRRTPSHPRSVPWPSFPSL